jgi:hypothetical protein
VNEDVPESHPCEVGVPRQRGLADVIDEIRQSQEARGFQGRGAEEIETGLREGDEEYDQRMWSVGLHAGELVWRSPSQRV